MLATDKCKNCGEEFGNHSFLRDPDVSRQWKCPHKFTDSGYGFFCGGDPRKFFPDADSCSEAELANHKAACELWYEAESRGVVPEPEKCPSGWIFDSAGNPVVHVLRAPYGIGCYTYECDQYWEPGGYDNADDEIEDLVINWDATAIDDGFEMLAEDDNGDDDLEF